MTTSLYQNIRGALAAAANGVSSAPQDPQRAYDGVVFDPTVGTPWMRQTLIPTTGRAFSVDADTKMHVGIYQIDLFYPSDTGTADIESVADAIKAAYPPGEHLPQSGTKVIIDYAERGQARPDGADPTFLHLPITVGWRCFSASN